MLVLKTIHTILTLLSNMASALSQVENVDSNHAVSCMFQHLENIISQGQKRVTIYVAIASAAHMAKQDPVTSLWSIEQRFEQQFPIFISSLKEICPDDPVHIFLIDPALEDPPFVVCDNKKKLSDCWTKLNVFGETVYVDETTNVHVYPMKFPVTYPGDMFDSKDSVNITEFLHTLNLTAIEQDWFVVVQDYSGRNISVVGDYFENDIKDHHSHIVYGIAAGADGGCYIDLTDPACNFVYQVTDTSIKVITIKCYSDRFHDFIETMNSFKSTQNENTTYKILRSQAKIYLEDKRTLINNEIMALLRQSKALMIGLKSPSSVHTSKKIENKYKIHIEKMILEKRYDDLFQAMQTILSSELKNFISPIYGKESRNVTENIMKEMLSIKDPYKWYDVVSRVISHCRSCIGLE